MNEAQVQTSDIDRNLDQSFSAIVCNPRNLIQI